jgi:metal-responsive CopG/Arc/MetJ family transcriptional regulator
MRKKIPDEEKNIKIGITIHPELDKILNEMKKDNNKTKSKIIQDIMSDYFKNKNNKL